MTVHGEGAPAGQADHAKELARGDEVAGGGPYAGEGVEQLRSVEVPPDRVGRAGCSQDNHPGDLQEIIAAFSLAQGGILLH